MSQADLEARIVETTAMLERAVAAAGHVMSGDGRVAEVTAAQLLGVSVGHLRRLRRHGELAAYRSGVNGSRISFRLDALARFVEETKDDLEVDPSDPN